MTPAEQDKELREKLNSLFESVFSQGVRAGKDMATNTYEDFDAWRKKGELDETIQLIAADRKRVALEARIEALDHIIDLQSKQFNRWTQKDIANFFNDVGKYYRELKAQQENP